ncbi:hypothetical protein KIPB_005341, partial [Kipferlia bialata]
RRVLAREIAAEGFMHSGLDVLVAPEASVLLFAALTVRPPSKGSKVQRGEGRTLPGLVE